jgi:hypothetical protein
LKTYQPYKFQLYETKTLKTMSTCPDTLHVKSMTPCDGSVTRSKSHDTLEVFRGPTHRNYSTMGSRANITCGYGSEKKQSMDRGSRGESGLVMGLCDENKETRHTLST